MPENQHNFSKNATLLHTFLNTITPHDLYGQFSSLLAETDYMLPSGAMFTDDILRISLLQHPMVVIRTKTTKERFRCVSNIRSFMLAHSVLKRDDALPVILIDRPTAEEISLLVNTDLVATSLLYSLRSPQLVGRVYEKLKRDGSDGLYALFQPGKETKTALAHQTGYALNTIFTPPDNPRRHRE